VGVPAVARHSWRSFSFIGLAVATLFFAASLTPSLLPRHFAVQGVLGGFALATGYAAGVLFVWVWTYLEIREPSEKSQRLSKQITSACVAAVAVWFLWRATTWQNSIRELMEMAPVASAYPLRVALIAVVVGIVLVLLGRGLIACGRAIHARLTRLIPRRVSYVVSTLLVILGVFLLANHVVLRFALNAADRAFLEIDAIIDDGIEQPTEPTASGSAESLVDWDDVGRRGKGFVVGGPTKEQISEFLGREAMRPLRVYVGLTSKDTVEERAELALQELIRAGGFERSVLIVATPTGTGWLDPGAVDTVEYLHAGDTAIVSMQYSYLPSWMTIIVDPHRSEQTAKALFDKIYSHWTTLDHDTRPKLYLHGLSLGALGSADSADLLTVFEDPIQGGVWSGPPFASRHWVEATADRNPGTPMWLPKFRDGSILRFTARENAIDQGGTRWGPMRFVYIQHASDPMSFFSTDLAYRRPAWLNGERGPDVSPELRWYPIVMFLQTAFDLPMATSVPHGYGHNFAAQSYIDAWIAVTAPENWKAEDTERLKRHFKEKEEQEESE
jgi:uncharacterized membrane protein